MHNESFTDKPFDPEIFRTEGHKTIDILADYLNKILSRPDTPVLPHSDPDSLAEYYSGSLEAGADQPLSQFLTETINRANHLHHPRYIGHQVTSPLPPVVLAQLCTTLLNNGAAIYEMGPVAMAMERNLIRYFASLIGYGEEADGIFTHGGSAGNLTAMLAARQIKSEHNVWEDGVRNEMRTGFIVTEQSHYSVARNVKIMGLGNDSLITIPYDNRFRMQTELLSDAFRKAKSSGIKVASVIANSCSTATGSYDNLEAIGSFCREKDLWMHVDGAHGMGVLFSEKHRDLIKGIEMADSIVIDFHKMLLVPALNTMVIFRNGDHSYQTFAQKASYLFNGQNNREWFTSAKRTLECTKSSLGLVAFTAVKYFGKEYYRNYIDSRYDLTARFAEIINGEENFEVIAKPDANILCFRYTEKGAGDDKLNTINSRIREEIVKSGSFYIVQAEIDNKTWLRVTIINPFTSEEDLRQLLTEISKRAAARW